MIDIHCHILPGVDDGAESVTMAVMMSAMAADDDQKIIVATPHIRWHKGYDPGIRTYHTQALAELRLGLQQARIPLTCILGAEVLMEEPARELLEQGLFPTIQGTDYGLMEFYFDAALEQMDECLEAAAAVGIHPIVAHPERYYAVQKDREHIRKWVELGYCIQVNKGSAFGQFGRKEQKIAQWMLKNRLADFWATDAHDTAGRTTRVSDALWELSKKYGQEYTRLLLEENPQKMLKNIPIRPLKWETNKV